MLFVKCYGSSKFQCRCNDLSVESSIKRVPYKHDVLPANIKKITKNEIV